MDKEAHCLPKTRHSIHQEQLKGEDHVFVHEHLEKLHEHPETMSPWSIYCVLDGHGGPEAAMFVKENLGKDLVNRLPKGNPPVLSSKEADDWLRKVRMALVDSFLHMDKQFKHEDLPSSIGTTVTVALVCGWILTIANVGDSEAFLDVGRRKAFELTTSHKLDTNLEEQGRLQGVGKQIAQLSWDLVQPAQEGEDGVGPLRIWPCGLAVSRSVGDYDCGCEVTAAPMIRQIEIPFSGSRMIMASDGVWDHVTGRRAMQEARKSNIYDCAVDLVALAEEKSKEGLSDDTSVLVVDFLPTSKTDWQKTYEKLGSAKGVMKRLRSWLNRSSVAHIPNKIQDYDGIAGSTCALMGEKLYQYQTSRLRRRYERSRRKGGKYESEPLFSLPELLSSFGDSSESSSSLESDNEEEAALEERKNKIANISSNLGLSIAEIRQGISSTRRQNSIDTSGTDVNE